MDKNKNNEIIPFTIDATNRMKKSIDKLGLDVVLKKLGDGGLLKDGKIPYYATYKNSKFEDISDLNYRKIKVGHGLIWSRNLSIMKHIYDVVKVVHKYHNVIFARSMYDGSVINIVVDEETGNLPTDFYAMRYITGGYTKIMFNLPKELVEIV